jgi:hypothetical protein
MIFQHSMRLWLVIPLFLLLIFRESSEFEGIDRVVCLITLSVFMSILELGGF